MKELLFAAAVAVSCVLVVVGVWEISRPAGLITSGVLLSGWSLLVLGEVRK